MTFTTEQNWQVANQRYLMNSLEEVHQALQRRIAALENRPLEGSSTTTVQGKAIATPLSHPPALEYLCKTFGLSPFERDILLFCVGMEFNPNWGTLCGLAQGDTKQNYPTFYLAQSTLNRSHWSAFTPASPLRRWQMIDLGPSNALLMSPLRIDERILHYLMGISQLDERLTEIVKPVETDGFLVQSHQLIVEQLTQTWQQLIDTSTLPMVQIYGEERVSKRAIAALACQKLGFTLYALSSKALPTNLNDLQLLIRLWEREAILSKTALLLDWDEVNITDSAKENAIALLIESVSSPLIVLSRDRRSAQQRPTLTFEVNKPTSSEQLEVWYDSLGDRASQLNGFVPTLVSQFNLSTPTIQSASLQVLGEAGFRGQVSGVKFQGSEISQDDTISSPPPPSSPNLLIPSSPPHPLNSHPAIAHHLWNICRVQSRPQLDDLAQRIEQSEGWEDLVLPEQQRQVLRDITSHVRQRMQVYEQWGFARKGGRGLGISALFAGTSGTGKTMAAGVLAQELKLDLYRIDLSSVVSKYIGETEKNLRRVFDAAEAGGVILLFDEADALFGKRSDVKDSHDRYANMEVSYLLQRMEAYRGLAILTTNLKEAIDSAFVRRLRFIIRFPFPDVAERTEIWQRVFPKDTPTQDLNYKKLAKLNIAGGNIRSIALNAAFLAADEGQPITMGHLLRAAQSEYIKLERTLTEAEIRGWISSG